MCCRPCDRGRAVTVTKDVANPFSFTWTIHTFRFVIRSAAPSSTEANVGRRDPEC